MIGRSGRIRKRDGWSLRSGSQRRKARKHGGLSARQQKKVVKARRSYKKATWF